MEDGMTPREFERAEGTEDWRVVGDGVTAFFPATSFEESVAFVQAISELPAVVAHQPDVDIRKDGVTCRLVTVADDYFGPTQRDAEAAREISAAARKLGLRAESLGRPERAGHTRRPRPGGGHALLASRPWVCPAA